MKNEKKLPDLLGKIKSQYELLQKIPLSPKFYETYGAYRNLAEEINNISKIESIEKNNQPTDGLFDSFFGYVTFRVLPIISLLQEQKKILFKKLPENSDEWFKNLQFHFLKLAKMEGDTRFRAWFEKTDKLLNDFLDQIETTEKGNKLFLETHIMNVMHELIDLVQARKTRKELQTSSLDAIRENDIHTLVTHFEKLRDNKKSESRFTPSLRDKGDVGIMNIYTEHSKTKDEMMTPVHIFQSKLPDFSNTQKNKKQEKRNEKDFYINQRGDDFLYKGKLLNRLDKEAGYYIVFCALYRLRSEGGEVTYAELVKELIYHLPKIGRMSEREQRIYIQKRLTEHKNYFQKYAELPDFEDNQRPLIKCHRNVGIIFNNRKG